MLRAMDRVPVCWRWFEMIAVYHARENYLWRLKGIAKQLRATRHLEYKRHTIYMACGDFPSSSGEGVRKADCRIHKIYLFFVQAGSAEGQKGKVGGLRVVKYGLSYKLDWEERDN